MENPFSLDDEKLSKLLSAYSNWVVNNEDEAKYPISFKLKAKELKENLLRLEYLSTVSDGKLAQEIFEYSRTLEGPAHIRLGMHRITERLNDIKRNLHYLIDSSDDPIKKAHEILEGKYKIPIFAKAFWTPIFQAQFPDELPNWNNKTEKFLEKFGIRLKTKKLSTEQKYRIISDAFLYLHELDPSQDFHQLNHLMHYGTVIDEGVTLIENLINDSNGGIGLFTEETFSLLDGLHKNPSNVFYQNKKKNFQVFVEKPLQGLLQKVSEKFSSEMAQVLETKKGLFSRILKNDYGQGGAWDFYWGAFYPKGGKRIEDAQLFVWVNREIFQFGFYIGKYGKEQRNRFLSNCKTHQSSLEKIFGDLFSDSPFIFGEWELELQSGDVPAYLKQRTWMQWLSDPAENGINVCLPMTKKEVLSLSKRQLIDKVLDAFKKLFTLVILAVSKDPIPKINNYLESILKDSGDEEDNNGEVEDYIFNQEVKNLFVKDEDFKSYVELLKYKKNLILQGPPGTGKTFLAKHLAYTIMGKKDNSRVPMVQFHQSYSYEDFIQGFRPNQDGKFDLKNGIFYDFCRNAQADSSNIYFFIIDEINRGNLSKIFGEMFMLIEADKRGPEFKVSLTYSKSTDDAFYIPENLYIIGTMNTADRSLAMVDYALRRRFCFIDLEPQFESEKFKTFLQKNKVPNELIDKLIDRMSQLNEKIAEDTRNLGLGYRIGHSYFCPVANNMDYSEEWYRTIIKTEIEPLLREYWFDDPEKVNKRTNFLLS